MDQVVLNTGEAPEIVITLIGGDLRLSGWEQNQFQAECEDERSLQAEQQENAIRLHCGMDCTVRVPRRAVLQVERVGGDARVKSVEGPVEIRNVGGDLVLRRTAAVVVGRVGGDVSAKKIDGPLRIEMASGDVSARSVAGEFHAEKVGADLYLRDVEAGAHANVGSDAILNIDFAPNRAYYFKAGGDIVCHLSPNASAKLMVGAGGDIAVDVTGAQIEGNSARKVVTLGRGEAEVTLQAGNDVSLTGLSADPDAMGDFGEHFGEEFGVMAEEFAARIESQIESQIEAQMADFEKQLSERMAGLDINLGGLGMNAEEIAARARRAAERATEAARRKAEAAQRRAERQAETAQRRAERAAERAARHAQHGAHKWRGFAFHFDAPRPPTPPAPPRPPTPPRAPAPPVEPVSNDERMAILRMVEQKKITVEEAEKLLAALEGKA
jgi:hypothetical protein